MSTIVVTGASRGIGRGLVDAWRQRGHDLAICNRSPSGIIADNVFEQNFDIRDESAVDAFAVATAARFGAIDLWVNNAGVLEPMQPLRNTSAVDFQSLLDINIMGVYLGSRAYARHVRGRAGAGVLINIGSGASTSAYAGWSAYCASKAAVDLMSECLALEEADAGLRVYAVAPGVVDTAMQEIIRASDEADFPAVDRFIELKQNDDFNSVDFVASQLESIAFGSGQKPASVVHRLPREAESASGDA